jgi:hypothetical protein
MGLSIFFYQVEIIYNLSRYRNNIHFYKNHSYQKIESKPETERKLSPNIFILGRSGRSIAIIFKQIPSSPSAHYHFI